MRKTSVRRFIHAVIDVLPLLIIPIFALNILHKETEPISITTSGYTYERRYKTNDVSTNNDLIVGNSYHLKYTYVNDSVWTGDIPFNYTNVYYQMLLNSNGMIKINYIYEIVFRSGTGNTNAMTHYDMSRFATMIYGTTNYLGTTLNPNYTSNTSTLSINYNEEGVGASSNITFLHLNLIFEYENGVNFGFENYSDYITSISNEDNPLLATYNEGVVYNNTDIGSQFIYALYKPVHDYFNFNNLFNMGAIYDWIELNLFSGTAPLPIFIIWNVIVYEFFVDLIFLLYGVFMFIIDFAEKCLERPFRR